MVGSHSRVGDASMQRAAHAKTREFAAHHRTTNLHKEVAKLQEPTGTVTVLSGSGGSGARPGAAWMKHSRSKLKRKRSKQSGEVGRGSIRQP
jgi:hypothetical protein